MISGSTLRLLALAIAGILVAAAIAVAASQLASSQIGLASEPVFAGDDLAPKVAKPKHKSGGDNATEPDATTEAAPAEASTTAPAAPPAEPTSPTGDDSGGSGAGGSHEGGSIGGDD